MRYRALALLSVFALTAPAMAADDAPSLTDLDGKTVNLAERNKDRIVAVIFTRTDCPISNRYAPEVRRLYERFHPRGVEFALVYVDPRETPEVIRQHLAEYGYPCLAYRDLEHGFVEMAGATVTPEAVVFDAEGKIVYRGRIDDLYADLGNARDEPTTHELADAIESTLNGKPVAVPETNAVGCNISDLK